MSTEPRCDRTELTQNGPHSLGMQPALLKRSTKASVSPIQAHLLPECVSPERGMFASVFRIPAHLPYNHLTI
jgi:hypothetical protein